MKQRTLIYVSLVVLFSGMCVIENAAVSRKPVDPADVNSSSVYALAGQFRTVFANLLWIKVDQYHHEFIAHNPDWTQNTALLGLLNLITKMDPHFVEAYATGTVIYANGRKDEDRALNFLNEGIRNNPEAWDLHRMAAIIYVRRFDQPEKALPHAKRAAYYCDDDFLRPKMYQLIRTVRRCIAEKQAAKAISQQKRQQAAHS